MRKVTLGLVGGGTVGGGVYQAIKKNGALMGSRLGVQLTIAKIAVRKLKKARAVKMPASILTSNWRDVVDDPAIEVVVELMGGVKLAREVVRAALENGKSVVTANKALLAAHGEELFQIAGKYGVNLYYEASVAGGIPIIKVLREALIGNRISSIYGILNGTCNYILTRMSREPIEFNAVLKQAQELGYAEAEPSLDVDGFDAAHKTGILASLAYGFWVDQHDVHVEGIRGLSRLDIGFADQLGYVIKLLGVIKQDPEKPRRSGQGFQPIQASVYPALIPKSHVLANINGVFNAVFVRGDIVGDTLYCGHGAGQDATASAVLSDIGDAALDLKWETSNRIPPFVPHERSGAVRPMDEVVSRYYVRLNVMDKPGVFARISAILADAGIGISSIIQPEGHGGRVVPVILMIYDAANKRMGDALKTIAKLDAVKGKPVMIRVEQFDPNE
ncbi:MAG: homoserine dehydrogenase [Verrucomicrobiae bacterium]|nr:homoserine dehydrogenase [Verrucomicrobiae bacterium]